MVAASYKDANGHAIASRHRAEYVALCRVFWETVMSFQTYDHGDATRASSPAPTRSPAISAKALRVHQPEGHRARRAYCPRIRIRQN